MIELNTEHKCKGVPEWVIAPLAFFATLTVGTWLLIIVGGI